MASRHRRRDDDDASPDGKRSRGSVSYHRDVFVRNGLSSPACSRGRDGAYRSAKQQGSGRSREDRTRKSVSSSRPEQTARHSATQQRHQLTVTGHGRAAVDDRKPTPQLEVDHEAEVARRLDIQRQREEARREMDRMVKTVEFNDPFISPLDMLKR